MADAKPIITVLESGAVPEADKVYRLYEDFSDLTIVDDPFVARVQRDATTGEDVIVESRKVGSKSEAMTIRGVFQRSDTVNANKRIYPRSIWEKWTAKDSDLVQRIAGRACLGQIEHPKDGAGNMQDAAIAVTSIRLEPDGTVIGEAEVLNTPCGRIVRDLLRSDIKIGISSRGTGSVDARGVVDERTYKPETWDIVGNPSTPGAYPRVVERPGVAERCDPNSLSVRATRLQDGSMDWALVESTGRVVRRLTAAPNVTSPVSIGDDHMSAKSKFDSLRTQVEAHIASPLSESTLPDLAVLDKALVESSVNAEQIAGEDTTLKPIVASLQERISGRRAEIQKELDERKTAAKSKPKAKAKSEACDDDDDDKKMPAFMKKGKGKKKDDDDEDDDDDDDSDESAEDAAEDEDEVAEGEEPATLEETLALLADIRPVLTAQEEKIAAQDELIEAMAEDLAQMERTTEQLTESLAAANAVIAEMGGEAGDDDAETVAEAIESAIKEDEALEESRVFLERCESVEEVHSLVERLSGAGDHSTDENDDDDDAADTKGLPKVGHRRSSLSEQRGGSGGGGRNAGPTKSRGALLVGKMLEKQIPNKGKTPVNG